MRIVSIIETSLGQTFPPPYTICSVVHPVVGKGGRGGLGGFKLIGRSYYVPSAELDYVPAVLVINHGRLLV